MRNRILLLALLLALPLPAAAAETSRLDFVTEYVRELGVNEQMRALAEHDITEVGTDPNAAIIRSSTRIILELNSQIEILKRMTLDSPFDSVPATVVQLYQYKIGAHQRMIDIATAFEAERKPGVDYGAMAAEAPKQTAMIEYIDRTLFETTPLIFSMLIADQPDGQNHMSRLRITRSQRDRLLRSLQTDFGDKMNQMDQNYIISAATVLRDYLSKKGYKCLDDAL